MSFPPSSLVASFMWDVLGVPPSKIPFNITTFAWYILPPLVCYFIAAVLALTPNTRVLRVAVCPIIALLAVRAAASVDVSYGEPKETWPNIDVALAMFCIIVRAIDWALAEKPLVRRLRPTDCAPSTIVDALDLCFNLRGHGWDWSRGLHVPPETRPTNRIAFVFFTFLSAVVHIFLCGALQRATISFIHLKTGPNVISIFDDTLPFTLRYLRASIITVLHAIGIYCCMQMGYDVFTIPAVLLMRQDPAQWPPAFNAPWRATSLGDFWGRRWHQWFRRTYIVSGGHPLSLCLGHAGIILGAFISSGIFHFIALVAIDCWEFWRMLIGFGMMGVGVVAERAFNKWTGRKVSGIIGWIWTVTWLVVWGSFIVEAFARAGMLTPPTTADSSMPVRLPVEHLVVGFDHWLHSI